MKFMHAFAAALAAGILLSLVSATTWTAPADEKAAVEKVIRDNIGWALGQTSDLTKVKEIMLTSIAMEITEREPHNGYLILQGGIPEVERFVSSYWK